MATLLDSAGLEGKMDNKHKEIAYGDGCYAGNKIQWIVNNGEHPAEIRHLCRDGEMVHGDWRKRQGMSIPGGGCGVCAKVLRAMACL